MTSIRTRRWRVTRAAFAARLPTPCGKCGAMVRQGDNWHLSHIHPRSQGGSNAPDNLQVQHARCNLSEAPRLAWQVKVNHRTAPPSRAW
jgi:5-methylcytosine-specific restriction endonuclease McrA